MNVEKIIHDMSTWDAAVQTQLNTEFSRVHGAIDEPRDGGDTVAFWTRVRAGSRG